MHLWAHSLGGPHPASQALPVAGWPGQVEGVGSAKAGAASQNPNCKAHAPGSHT